MLEPDVVVQPRRAVLVDHERVAGANGLAGRGLGGAFGAELTATHVLEQRRVLRGERDLVRGLGGDGTRRRARRRPARILLGLHAERLHRRREVVVRTVANRRPAVADLGEALPYIVDPEVLGLEPT